MRRVLYKRSLERNIRETEQELTNYILYSFSISGENYERKFESVSSDLRQKVGSSKIERNKQTNVLPILSRLYKRRLEKALRSTPSILIKNN